MSVRLALLALVLAGALAGCTSSTPDGRAPTTSVSTVFATRSVGSATPVEVAPTTSKTAARCPFLALQTASDNSGLRLDRITVQSSGGRPAGCRIYALEHPVSQCDQSCLDGEHLPPSDQPAIEIGTMRYANPSSARRGLIQIAEAGTSVEQEQIAAGNTGLCYRTDFWSKDSGEDWACAFTKRSSVIVIRTVITSPALDVVEMARAVYPTV